MPGCEFLDDIDYASQTFGRNASASLDVSNLSFESGDRVTKFVRLPEHQQPVPGKNESVCESLILALTSRSGDHKLPR